MNVIPLHSSIDNRKFTIGEHMCITVITGDLGPAHAGLDARRLLLVLSPALSPGERVLAARRLLVGAGPEQPSDAADEVICLCGLSLDVALTDLDRAADALDSVHV